MNLKKALTTDITMPFWVWSILLILLGWFSADRLVQSYRGWQWNRAYEQCERQSPKPCKFGKATITIYKKTQ